MPVTRKQCEKCGFNMSKGVLGTDKMSKCFASKFVEGEEGEKDLRVQRGVDSDQKAGKAVEAWRCENCGYLEMFVPNT